MFTFFVNSDLFPTFAVVEIMFEKKYLLDLYTKGDGGKKHRYQPNIVRKYTQIIDLMIELEDVSKLKQFHSLNYERLIGDKTGLSSVRVNDKYRIEFEEIKQGSETFAKICNITELSNHYH